MHSYMNIKKLASISGDFWDVTDRAGLFGLVVAGLGEGRHRRADDGHEFVNMSSYSYLGLDTDPRLVQAAAEAVLSEGSLNTSTSRMRIRFAALEEAERALSEHFDVEAVTTASCAVAAWASLPLLASGLFTEDVAPVMAFDKNAHFCLNALKAAAADEAQIVTIAHNDVEALEQLCKEHPKVAYVADGVYSTGGQAPVKELLRLQEKYGLFLYFDEAHGISTLGQQGRGLVLEELGGRITDRTIIIASLNKGFGASGGAIFLGPQGSDERKNLALRNGPLMWSQRVNTAGLGAIKASVALHATEEFAGLQKRLQDNIDLFDGLVQTEQSHDGLPIRFVEVGKEDATVQLAQRLLEQGFYASPIFFPIIGRGRAGLRLMLRANMTRTEIETFAGLLKELRDELAPTGTAVGAGAGAEAGDAVGAGVDRR